MLRVNSFFLFLLRNEALKKDLTNGFSLDDIVLSTTSSFTPSAVTQINNEDVFTYLETLSQLGQQQDPDSLYNNLMYSVPFASVSPGWSGYFGGSGRYAYEYPGANTTFTFANGTTKMYTTTASVIGDFASVVDGESFYQKFCTGPKPAPPAAISDGNLKDALTASGYPTPQVKSSDGVVAGYFLTGKYSNVAVLAMTSFEPKSPVEFQAVVQQFLAEAKKAGKTKLVVDLSANGGGFIFQGKSLEDCTPCAKDMIESLFERYFDKFIRL